MLQGVGDQVVDDLAYPPGVGHDHRGLGGVQRDRAAGVGGAGVLGGLGRDAGQVDGRPVEGAAGVVVREEEQVFDELAHAAGFALDHAHEPQQFAGWPAWSPCCRPYSASPADGGEGSAQLVAGVGGELPHPDLGAPGLFLPAGACLVSGLDGAEHGVQRAGKPADLGPLRRMVDAPGEVTVRDGGGGCLDLG